MYLGEEWGMLNDYDFVKDPAKAGDTRWIHRPKMKWEYLEELEVHTATGNGSIHTRIFQAIRKQILLRKNLPALAGQDMHLVPTGNVHILGFLRVVEGNRMVVLANFADVPQSIDGNTIRTAGMGRFFEDVETEATYATSSTIELAAYQLLWLRRV